MAKQASNFPSTTKASNITKASTIAEGIRNMQGLIGTTEHRVTIKCQRLGILTGWSNF